jgi:hypothetical protein
MTAVPSILSRRIGTAECLGLRKLGRRRAKAVPAAAAHDEPLRAANELDSVPVQYFEELGLVNAETPVLVRCVMAVKARQHVHQHDTIRFI